MEKYHVQNYVFAILFVFNFAIQANTITVHFAVLGDIDAGTWETPSQANVQIAQPMFVSTIRKRP